MKYYENFSFLEFKYNDTILYIKYIYSKIEEKLN